MAQLTALDQVDISDDRPLAVRRKRRCSSALAEPIREPKLEPIAESTSTFTHIAETIAATPGKAKKKVRFSDPGVDTTALATDTPAVNASTGLTPAFNRTSFAPYRSVQSPRSLIRPARQQSLPNLRVPPPTSHSPSPSPAPLSGEIQFAPFRDILDDRVKRRLRRNGLSEEFNEIEAEKKTDVYIKRERDRELVDLKADLAFAKKQQIHGEADGECSPSKGLKLIRRLEHRLEQLMTKTPVTPSKQPMSQCYMMASSPTICMDDSAVGSCQQDSMTYDGSIPRTSNSPQAIYSDVSTQHEQFMQPHDVKALQAIRLSLEHLFPGEITLGLVPDDPQPLLDVMLRRLQMLQARTLIAEDQSATTKTQEANLRTQFNAVLEQLDRARKYAEKVGSKHHVEKARADAAEGRLLLLETDAQSSVSKSQEVDAALLEKDRSLQRLQEALDSYRSEVGKLEQLVSQMEHDNKANATKLKSEMDEAVADLECHVTAEANGRRAAEAVVEQRDQKIRELRRRERELSRAVNEKQQIIRDTEQAFSAERLGRGREVGGLNVQISALSSDLHNCDQQRRNAEKVCRVLVQKLQAEKEAGERAMAAIQEELQQCTYNAHGIGAAYESDSRKRGADVLEHKGLLTPTTGGRFRDGDDEFPDNDEGDIAGFVEVRRGRKAKGRTTRRPDSGIVILEEDQDEDEDLVMNDY